MRLTPALAYEKLRQDADSMNKIILNKDGKWYHVYEWSAWLFMTSDILGIGSFNSSMTDFTLRTAQ